MNTVPVECEDIAGLEHRALVGTQIASGQHRLLIFAKALSRGGIPVQFVKHSFDRM